MKRHHRLLKSNVNKFIYNNKLTAKTVGNKTYESEELVKKRKLMELRREIEQQRKQIMEEITNDIKAKIKMLDDASSEEEKRAIE